MEKINEAWKNASEELYKATQEAQGGKEDTQASEKTNDGDVTDVDFEEIKEEDKDKKKKK